MSDDSEDYEIGYKRPPKETRFKKGQSGNPSGKSKRPRRTEADEIADSVKRSLDKRHQVTHNNRKKMMRRGDILGEQIVNAALSKNVAMTKLAIDLEHRANEARRAQPQDDFNESDAAIFDALLKRLADTDDDPGIEGVGEAP